MEFTGVIKKVFEPRTGVSQKSGNSWKAQEFLIEEVTGQYPKKMVFEVFGEDKLNKLNILEGLEYTISFDIEANEWNGKWYNKIRAWDARPVNAAAQQPAPQQQSQQQPQPEPAPAQDPFAAPADEGEGNLPF